MANENRYLEHMPPASVDTDTFARLLSELDLHLHVSNSIAEESRRKQGGAAVGGTGTANANAPAACTSPAGTAPACRPRAGWLDGLARD